MSWKGFQKSIVRAPQQVRQRIGRGEITKDATYIDAELRFTDMERETKKLKEETTKYFQAINGMLDHQIEFSKACAEIYKPISGRASDPDSYVIDSNPEGIRAAEEYIAIVNELKNQLSPELEMIKTRVVGPAEELMAIVQCARKWTTKRNHKQLDYDQRKHTLTKLQEKPDKSAKDEKNLWEAENKFEEINEVYNEINTLVTDELLQLFGYEKHFILPLFQSFYYMQLNVFYTLHETMQSIDIGYFNLTKGIEEAFEEKRGDIQQQAEALSIVKFKTTGKPRPARPGAARLALENGRAKPGSPLALEDAKDSSPVGRRSHDSYDTPPPYESGGLGRSASTGASWGATVRSKAAPPPPKPKPGRLSGVPQTETVTALYDYEAQAEGDLSFSAGDTIEVVSRTDNENEWWIGKVGDKQGQFPGNYVQLNS